MILQSLDSEGLMSVIPIIPVKFVIVGDISVTVGDISVTVGDISVTVGLISMILSCDEQSCISPFSSSFMTNTSVVPAP